MVIAGPVMNEETLVTADIDLSRIAEESLALDVTGHYSRPDIFELKVCGVDPFKRA
jgi:predicted amidohydrolase